MIDVFHVLIWHGAKEKIRLTRLIELEVRAIQINLVCEIIIWV